jgi:hypothetical protein
MERNLPTQSALTQRQINLIQNELALILQSQSFRNSPRCRDFLNFVVASACDGRLEDIKERTIGIEVFGRPVGFETSGDSIVRVRATEVRNRLLRFYTENPESRPVRIDLPLGAYIPQFGFLDDCPPVSPSVPAETPSAQDPPARSWTERTPLLILSCVVLLALAVGLWQFSLPRTPFQLFWEPFLARGQRIMVVLPDSFHLFTRRSFRQKARDADRNQTELSIGAGEFRAVDDFHLSFGLVRSFVDVQRILIGSGMEVDLRFGSQVSAGDLHKQPVVLFGAANQPWSPEQLSKLRYQFAGKEIPGGYSMSLIDSQTSSVIRKLDNIYPWVQQTSDFAIITRLVAAPGLTPILSIAGLSMFGTEAAASAISDPGQLNRFGSQLPAGWEKKNLQMVVGASVVNRSATNVHLVASYAW